MPDDSRAQPTPTTFEQLSRQIATHRATCGGRLFPMENEWNIRPLEAATIALSCDTCGAECRATFTAAEVASFGSAEEIALRFEELARRAIN